jgi:hypothetical protein
MKAFGFDYVLALSVDRVNRILADTLAHLDMTIAYSAQDPDRGSTIGSCAADTRRGILLTKTLRTEPATVGNPVNVRSMR